MLYMYPPTRTERAGFISAIFVSRCSLFSAAVTPHLSLHQMTLEHRHVLLVSDTSVPQLRISLKTFDKPPSLGDFNKLTKSQTRIKLLTFTVTAPESDRSKGCLY